MTTIAYKDYTLSWDSQGTGDFIYSVDKATITSDDLYVSMGDLAPARLLIRGLVEGLLTGDLVTILEAHNVLDSDFSVIRISRSLEMSLWHSNLLNTPGPGLEQPWAYGSGGSYALGALEFTDSVKAVEVAKKYDPYTGGRVQSFDLKRWRLI